MSVFKTYEITVDTMIGSPKSDVRFSQGDLNSSKLIINIKHDGKALNLTDCQVRLALLKLDNNRVYQECKINDKKNGIVEVILSSQSLSIIGKVEAEITIAFSESKTMVTPRFSFIVEKPIMNDNVVKSMNEVPILEKTISIANSLTSVDINGLITAGENIAEFKTNVVERFNYVTPEMFGAVGDGIADDTQAIIDADLYAIRNDLKLVGNKTYKITRSFKLLTSFVDFSAGKIILADNFPSDKALILTGISTTDPGYIRLHVDGNRDNQSLDICFIYINDYKRLGLQIDVRANNCFNAITVRGATEKGNINISARNTDRVLIEEGQDIQNHDTTPDEICYFINDGYNCKQYYFKESISASVVTFNTENSHDTSGTYKYLVDIQCDFKNTQLLGIIRTPAIKTIGIDKNSIVSFNGLIVYSPADLALDVISARTISGSIDIESAYNCGAWIRGVNYASYLDIKVSNFRGQYPVKFGEYIDSNNYKRVNNSQFNVFVSALIGNANLLEIDYARRSVINLFYTGNKPSSGSISIKDPEIYFTLNIDCGVIQNNIPITKTNTNACDINFVGGTVSKDSLLNYSTPQKGMKAFLRTSGAMVTYDGSKWQLPVTTVLT